MNPKGFEIPTLAQIHDEVTRLLEQNPRAVQARRKTVRALGEAMSVEETRPVLRRRSGWFSTTQTATLAGGKEISLQVSGVEVGKVRFDGKDGSFWFVPTQDGLKGERWRWSHHAEDGKRIRDYLKRREEELGKKSPEREVQWQLAAALNDRAKPPTLRNLRPVQWIGRFTEIGVAVTRTGKLNTGNIDLLVRSGRGPAMEFLVFEVKGVGETDVGAALVQAVRYATALEFESRPQQWHRAYHAAFGSSASSPLRIGAVAVMEDTPEVRSRGSAALEQLMASRGDSRLTSLDLLLFRFDPERRRCGEWNWVR